MKFINIFTLFTSFILTFAYSTLAMPYPALNNKRDSSIANTFKTINDLISELKQIQEAAGQTGTPDFSKASGYLAQLAQTAESAA